MLPRRPTSKPCLPCLPRSAKEPPSGPDWIHEIKHDGFRILARREASRVRLYTRNGYDFTARFPKIAATVETLPVRSCMLDGEAIVVDERGSRCSKRYAIGRTIMPPSYVPSICSNSTARTSGGSRSNTARQRSPIYYAVSLTASPSIGISPATVR